MFMHIYILQHHPFLHLLHFMGKIDKMSHMYAHTSTNPPPPPPPFIQLSGPPTCVFLPGKGVGEGGRGLGGGMEGRSALDP